MKLLRHSSALTLFVLYLNAPISGLATITPTKYSTYTNEAYGLSFRYPSDWTLKEGNRVKLWWGYLGVVDNSLPHGATVVFVNAPIEPDYAPSGFLTASDFLEIRVDSNTTPFACNQSSFVGLLNSDTDNQLKAGEAPTVNVGEIEFTEAQESNLGLGHQAISRYYHVFQNGACYEFQLGLNETFTTLSRDGLEDEFSELKDILASVTIRPRLTLPRSKRTSQQSR